MSDRKVYFGMFGNANDVIERFEAPSKALDNAEVLFAWYDGGYECSATVVFRRDGKLYEVNGSHCSCYGLEGQWEPEETTVEALALRMPPGYYAMENDADESWKEMLNELGRGNS